MMSGFQKSLHKKRGSQVPHRRQASDTSDRNPSASDRIWSQVSESEGKDRPVRTKSTPLLQAAKQTERSRRMRRPRPPSPGMTPWDNSSREESSDVFGQVVAGLDVLDRVESVDVDEDDKPVVVVCISACGELPTAAPAKATSATSGERTVDVGNKEAGIDTTGAVAVDATDSTQRSSEAQTIFEQQELDPELSTLLQSAGLASLTDIFREEELTLELLCSMKVDDRKRSLMAVGIPASDLDALEKTLATVL